MSSIVDSFVLTEKKEDKEISRSFQPARVGAAFIKAFGLDASRIVMSIDLHVDHEDCLLTVTYKRCGSTSSAPDLSEFIEHFTIVLKDVDKGN